MDASRRKLRDLLGAAVFFTLSTVVLTYPLALHLGDSMRDDGDSYEYAWVLGFGAYQLLHDPLHLYDGNILYPFPSSLAFSDSTLPNVVLGTPIVLLTSNPVLALNLLILLTFALGGLGMYLFVLDRTGSRFAALAAGVVYGFSSYRYNYLAQLPNVSMEWAPFALWTFEKYLATGRGKWVAGFALTTLLQILVSFYYAFILGIGIGIYVIVRIAQSRAVLLRPRWVLQLLGCLGVAAAVLVPAVLPYFQVEREFGLKRTLAESTSYSAWPANYLAAAPTMRFVVIEPLVRWLNATDPLLQVGAAERQLYLGTLALLLALVALGRLRWTGWLAPILMVILGIVLSFGPTFHSRNDVELALPFPMPYTLLYQVLPGFAALRVPSRFAALALLGLAILAGDGLASLLSSLDSRRGSSRISPVMTPLVGAGCIVLLLAESLNRTPLTPIKTDASVPAVYRWLAAQPNPSPVLELPIDKNGFHQSPLSYYSTYHHQPIVNGSRSFLPPAYTPLAAILSTFPSRMATDTIARLGVRYVIVHRAELEQSTLEFALGGNPDVRPVRIFGTDAVFEVGGQPETPALLIRAAPPCVPNPGEPGTMPVTLQATAAATIAVLAPGTRDVGFVLDWKGQSGNARQEIVKVTVPASVLELPATLVLNYHSPPQPDDYSVTISLEKRTDLHATSTGPLAAIGPSSRQVVHALPRLTLARLPASRGYAGGGIPYELLWQFDAPPAEPSAVYVNVYDDKGRFWSYPLENAEHFDHTPLCPGGLTLDTQRLRLRADTPPGLYQVEVVVESLATANRVPFLGPNGDVVIRVDLGAYRILPVTAYPTGSFVTNAGRATFFGGAIALDRAQVAGPTRPGAELPIDLSWSAVKVVPVDYTAFIHLTDPSGRVIAQLDGPPGGAGYPTSAWLPGDTLADRRALILPANLPGGPLDVRVGLYDLQTMKRLPVTGGNGQEGPDYVTIGTINR